MDVQHGAFGVRVGRVEYNVEGVHGDALVQELAVLGELGCQSDLVILRCGSSLANGHTRVCLGGRKGRNDHQFHAILLLIGNHNGVLGISQGVHTSRIVHRHNSRVSILLSSFVSREYKGGRRRNKNEKERTRVKRGDCVGYNPVSLVVLR